MSEQLIFSNDLPGQLKSFLLSCRVDGLAPATLRYYKQFVGRFVDFLVTNGVTDPEAVTANHYRAFQIEIQKTNKPVSVADFYRAIKRFFNWLVAERVLGETPLRSIRPPKIDHLIVRPFNIEEIKAMLAACDPDDFMGKRDTALILLFLDTGLRLREMADIQLADIDFEHECIKVMGKGSKERVVGMSRKTQKALLEYLKMRRESLPSLWVSHEDTVLTQWGIYHAIKRLGKKAGLHDFKFSPHVFRHTNATMSLINGASEFDVQRLLGHATLTMTRRYSDSLRSEHAVENHKKFSPVDRIKGI